MGRRIFVTGGMGGIGRACVERFIAQGDRTTFTYAQGKTDEKELHAFLAALGERASAIAIELSDPSSIRVALGKAQQEMGEIDTLVNAAAVGSATVALFADDKDQQDSQMLAINALGALQLSEAFIEITSKNSEVRKLINFSSVGGGFQAFPRFRLSDGMSKAAVAFLTRQLAAENVHSNVDIFAIAPGATNTGMFQASTLNGMSDSERNNFLAKLPKGRLIEPEEIADLVIFLSAPGSTYLHGAVMDASMGLGVRPGLISEGE
jgi:NAD(P)-dependent dehydrogenase (short-subunit alcohol dehydrogenase family)